MPTMNNSASASSLAIPNLPGYQAPGASKGKPKKNTFKIVHGVMVENPPTKGMGKSQSDTSLWSANSLDSNNDSLGTSMNASSRFSKSNKVAVPTMVRNEKMVLNFSAYFKEAVNESAVESFRVRRCTVYYYLEDDTIQVIEHRQENSGIPQGTFLKRHAVLKDKNTETFFGVGDFRIGDYLQFYGRCYQLVDCNPSTRRYLEEVLERDYEPPVDIPEDFHGTKRTAQMARETGKDGSVSRNVRKSPMKRFMEASLGNTVRNDGRSGFENHDRMVLRFNCVWKDPALFGEEHEYKLLYYLSDDTMEVLEVPTANSGRDPFPKLLARCKLTKNYVGLNDSDNGRGVEEDDGVDVHYYWPDLVIGEVVNIYKRDVRILDADAFTRDFYISKNRPLADAVKVAKEAPKKYVNPVPKFMPNSCASFGSEEDSLASCQSLVAKPPRSETWTKMYQREKVLRFKASLNSSKPTDEGREFIICYFMNDNTLQVQEPPKKNTGVMGGKFLQRKKYKHPTEDRHYSYGDFFAGAKVQLAGHKLHIDDVDEHTLHHMEENTEQFPFADIGMVMRVMRKKLQSMSITSRKGGGLVRDKFEEIDSDRTGSLDKAELHQLLRTFFDEKQLPDQAIITVMRHFDSNGDGHVTFNEFFETIMTADDIREMTTSTEKMSLV